MAFKPNIRFEIRTRIQCPKCAEMVDKPAGEDTRLRCPRCGTQVNVPKKTIDDAIREAEAKAAGPLGGTSIPLPPPPADVARARSLSRSLSVLGAVVAAWAIFFPFPYVAAIAACALVPAVSILLMARLKGRIRFETKEGKTEAPYLTLALAAPPAALAMRALYDFHILAFDAVWLPVAVVAAVFCALIFAFSADMKAHPLYLLVALAFGVMYAYGVVIEANCLEDRSPPKTYLAKVLGKRSSYSSKSHSYYITVTPWGPRTAAEEISIRKSQFERIQMNDEIAIGLREGYLSIPWFFIQSRKR